MDDRQFANPPASCRLLPFWFWNGDMQEEEICSQIAEMAAQGLGGFFLCARQGLTVPYLSGRWFRLVKLAVAEAKKHGMKAWLYDEYPYPSGIAGGEVTLLHPDAKQRIWRKYQQTCEGGQEARIELPLGFVQLACAVPYKAGGDGGEQLDWSRRIDLASEIGIVQPEELFQQGGLTPYNKKRYFSANPGKRLCWTAPQGKWEVIVIADEELCSFKYYGTYVDPCHPEAMSSFIALTHERYAQHLGDELGQTVPGIFTDEVGLEGLFPWTPQLPEAFFKAKGYRLLEAETLLDLWFERGERTAVVRYDYMDCMEKQLRENYHRRMHDWCEQHGIAYVTEVNSMRGATQLYSHIPSADSGHEKLGIPLAQLLRKNAFHIRYNPKMASSIARQAGREQALVECFHSIGWSMTLLDAKWMIDRFAALGINTFTPHAYFYSTNGIRKHDAPPSQFVQNPYWKWMHQLTDYAGRMSYLLRQGTADIRIAVLDPMASLWSLGGNSIHGFHPVTGEDHGGKLERLKTDWAAICEQLLMHQIDFDHLDAELLDTRAIIANGKLQIGDAGYEMVILPPLRCLEPAAWHKLEQFLQQGGTVLSLGSLPELELTADGNVCAGMRAAFGCKGGQQQANEQGRWYKGEHRAYFYNVPGMLTDNETVQQYLTMIRTQIAPAAWLTVDQGDSGAALMQVRQLASGERLVFVTNQEKHPIKGQLWVRHEPGGAPNIHVGKLNLFTGTHEAAAYVQTDEGIRIPLQLGGYESCWMQVKRTAQPQRLEPAAPAQQDAVFKFEHNTGELWKVRPEAANLLRLSRFRCRLDEQDEGRRERWHLAKLPGASDPFEPQSYVELLAGGGKQLQPASDWTTGFGVARRMELHYPVIMWYETEFNAAYVPAEAWFAMESAAISGRYEIYVNGQLLPPAAFGPMPELGAHRIGCPAAAHLRTGGNRITIRAELERDWHGVVEPIFLAGAFGVHFDQEGAACIVQPAEELPLRRGPWSSYPFYCGTMVFSQTYWLEERPQQSYFEWSMADWDDYFDEAAEVAVNGQSLGVHCLGDYRWTGSCEWLRQGANSIEVKVTNTLIGSLDGMYFDPVQHKLRDVREIV
ncbi:glycosyl hydrolase [Paenibacillus sp. GCM10027626]|uniref:glycosyl hydrolase n=1 Tax=Paenibacillus sp. GCM10027626 TaxID=3273411 RepID=UPI00363DF790